MFLYIAFAFFAMLIALLLMYKMKDMFEINYIEYIVWCIAEIVTICLIYTGFTTGIAQPEHETFWEVFGRALLYVTIALGFPYLVSAMYFAIIDKNNTIRLLNYEDVVTDEPMKPETKTSKITLFDNSGALKLSINPENLYYIESDDNYIKVWYTDSKGELAAYTVKNGKVKIEIPCNGGIVMVK